MTAWPVVRVAGPVSIGLALVILRPSWVSVAVLALLLVVAMWFDGQERRADDVEALESDLREEILKARAGAVAEAVEHNQRGWELHDKDLRKVAASVGEHATRLDAMAQHRKGPIL